MDKQREEFDVWLKESDKHVYDVYMDGYSSSESIENMCVDWAWYAWQQAQKVVVPDGFVVVPIKPTWEMINAGENACYGDDEEICKIVYKAMIEAGEKK